MKAMIFAAGLGTRLGKITAKQPKCLVDVGGKPILQHVLERVKRSGIEQVVINLHHFAGQVEQFLESHSGFGLSIHVSHEEQLLETGGGLLKVREYFEHGEPFLVHNADIYTDLDLQALYQFHQQEKPLGTLLCPNVNHDRVFLYDQDSRLIGWENRITGQCKTILDKQESSQQISGLPFGGIYVLSPKIFTFMDDEPEKFSIVRTFLNGAQGGERIVPYRADLKSHSGAGIIWSDIGSPEELEGLRRQLQNGGDSTTP